MPESQLLGQSWPQSGGYKFYLGLYMENCRNVPSHEAYAYQILHVAKSSGRPPRMPNLYPWGQICPALGGHNFYMGLGLPYFACSLILWPYTKSAQIIALGSNLAPPWESQVVLGLKRENFRKLYVPSHKALGYQILHVTLFSGPSPRGVNYSPKVELIAKGHKFYMGLQSEIFRNLVTKHLNNGYQF